jgi:hypothetical protein
VRVLKNLLIAIIILFLFVNVAFQLLWLSVERTVLNNSYYLEFLAETAFSAVIHERFYKELPSYLSQNLPPIVFFEDEETEEETVDERDDEKQTVIDQKSIIFADILAGTFNPQWLETQILIIVDRVLTGLESSENDFDISLELEERNLALRDALLNTPEVNATVFISALAIPDQFIFSKVLIDLGIETPVEELRLSFIKFRDLMRLWPYIITFFLVLFLFLLAGLKKGLIFAGAATFVPSFLYLFVLQLWPIFSKTYANLALLIINGDQFIIPLAMINILVDQTVDFLMPMPLVFLVPGFVALIAGILIKKT